MSTEKIIDQISSKIQAEVISSGNNMLNADLLLQYIEQVKNGAEIQLEIQRDLAKYAHERNMETFKANIAIKNSNYTTLFHRGTDVMKAVIKMGQVTINTSILINGAAAIALLAFLGNTFGKGASGPSITPFIKCLFLFAWGVFSGAWAAGFTYLAQSFFAKYYEAAMQVALINFNNPDPVGEAKKTMLKWGYFFQALAIVATATSLILFFFAVYGSGKTFEFYLN